MNAPERGPVTFPYDLPILKEAVKGSKFLCYVKDNDSVASLAEFKLIDSNFCLIDRQGVQIASAKFRENYLATQATTIQDFITRAEQLAKAHHLLTLTSENPEEDLEQNLDISLGKVTNFAHDETIEVNGSGAVSEGQKIYITMTNTLSERLYVDVFNINATGEISHMSRGNPQDIYLPLDRGYRFGADRFNRSLIGLDVTWPVGISRTRPFNEYIVFVLKNSPVNIRSSVEKKD